MRFNYEHLDTQDAKEMQSLLGKLYRLIHSANKKNSCYEVHVDWKKEFGVSTSQSKPSKDVTDYVSNKTREG